MWASHCSRDEDYFYTKNDANIAFLLYTEIKNLEKQYYEENKAKKMQPKTLRREDLPSL